MMGPLAGLRPGLVFGRVLVFFGIFFWVRVACAQDATLVFPQIVDGGGIRSEIILSNPVNLEDSGTISFWDSSGAAQSLMVSGTPQSSIAFSIPPGGVTKIETDGTGEPKSGYATVVANNENTQITGSIIYAVDGFEVSVPSSPLSARYHVFVERNSTANSGVAFANPGQEGITVTLLLLDQNGQTVDEVAIELGVMSHLTQLESWCIMIS